MDIALLGINHTQTEIKNFEPIFLNHEGKKEFRGRIANSDLIDECVVLTTCNRVEFYFSATDLPKAAKEIINLLSIQKSLDPTKIKELLTLYTATDATQHLFEVACGIQSMVLGENEILGQIKDSYDNAFKQQLTGPLLNKCFQTAINVGKRARSETTISRGAYSVSSIAIEALRQTYLDYFGKSICIIGTGTMGSRCLKKLVALGHPDITITNRTNASAKKLADEHGVNYLDYDTAFSQLASFDVIISAIAVRQPVIFADHLNLETSTLLIDLGLPRNVDPNLEATKTISLVNVDGLKEIASKNIHRRQGELTRVQSIIEEELQDFFKWHSFRQANLKVNQ